ncbi:MAG: LysR family transcriptional regulator [Eubacteriales bacterium]|nr:LysR family transcriptional regulator [Eubacteriales bacterium]
MDNNKYQVFLEVARCNSISKAAENLGYTQSGVSHTLKRMEADFNLPLFYRNRNGAFLTPAGEELYPHIMQMMQCQKNLNQTILSLHDLHRGTLNIGTYSSISRNWLPAIIHQFKQDYPSIKIHFKEGGNKDILGWLQNHEVDLGFLSMEEAEGLEWIPLVEDPLLAVLPSDYPLPSTASIDLKHFNDKIFIISALGTDIDIHRVLRKYHISPDIQYSAKDDDTIISMVEHHLGISILPELVLKDSHKDVITLPLYPYCSRTLGIMVPALSLSSPVTTRFIEYTKEYVK